MTGAAIAAVAYAALAACAWRLGPFHEHLPLFWLLYALAFLGMAMAARGHGRPLGPWSILAGALLFRAVLVPFAPSLSDDLYRYVWEGRVQNAGFDPFRLAPDAPALAPLRDAVWEHVNHREYTAIYPPLAQLAFRALAPAGGTAVFKLAFVLVDVLTVGLLLRALARAGGPARRAVWYAWNPLAVVEVGASGHFEPLALLPLVAAVAWAHPPAAVRGAWGQARAWAAFAASACAKYAALAALPTLLRHAPPRGRALAAAAAVTGLCFLAFAPAGTHLFDSLRAYAEHWRFNDFAFAWLRGQVADPLTARRIALLAAVLVAGACAVCARSLAGAACGALLGALLCAPTVHPWYLLWPLVLVPLCTSRAVLVWSATIPLAYHFLYPAAAYAAVSDAAWGLRAVQMAPVVLALVWDLVAWRRARAPVPHPGGITPRPRTRQVGGGEPGAAAAPSAARVALVMPALDEEAPLPLVLADLEPWRRDRPHAGAGAWIDEIVLVDNGSRDRTPAIARAAGATVLHEPARGYGAACLRALAHLRHRPPDLVLFMDADHSDDVHDIPAVLGPLVAGEADLVIGSRTRGAPEPGALLPQARFGNWLATRWIRAWYGFRYTDLGPFRAIRWQALEKLSMRDRDWGWTLEMQVRALQEELRVVEVPVRYRRRVGTSKISGTVLGSYRAGKKILWMMWTLRRPVRQDDAAGRQASREETHG